MESLKPRVGPEVLGVAQRADAAVVVEVVLDEVRQPTGQGTEVRPGRVFDRDPCPCRDHKGEGEAVGDDDLVLERLSEDSMP